MKAGLITVFVLMMAGHLSGCGQKGPLVQDLPAKPESGQVTAPGNDEDRPR